MDTTVLPTYYEYMETSEITSTPHKKMQKLIMLQAYIAHLQTIESIKVENDEDGISVDTGEGTTIYIQFGDEGYSYKVWVDAEAPESFGSWYKDSNGWAPLETVSQAKKLIWE